MLSKKLFSAILFLSLVGRVIAADAVPMDALHEKFPDGIPWKVDVFNSAGKSIGELQMRITSDHAKSCWGEVGDGTRVDFVSNNISPPLHITSYGVARFTNEKIAIDLTGGTCDAYRVMEGNMRPDGSSEGRIYSFGPFGSHDVGLYRATVE